MKIKTTFTLAFIFFSIAAIIVFSIFTSQGVKGENEKHYISLVEENASKQSSNAQLYLESLTNSFTGLSENTVFAGYVSNLGSDSEKAAAYIDAFNRDQADVTSVSLVDAEGNILLSSDRGIAETVKMETVLQNNDNECYIYSPKQKSSDFDFILTVKKDMETAALVVTYSGSSIKKVVEAASQPAVGKLMLVDPDYGVIDKDATSNNVAYMGFLDTEVGSGYPSIYEFVKNNSTGGSFKVSNAENRAYQKKIGNTGWIAVSIGDLNQALSVANSATSTLTVITVILCAVSLVAAFIIVSRFIKPLNVINNTIMQIRRGDHDARINIMSKNEYGEIARGFNDLIDDIVVSEARYRTIIEMSDNIIFEWNLKTNEVYFSNNFNKKFSYRAPSDHFGDSFLLKCKVHPDDASRYRADLESLGKGNDWKRNEYRIKNIFGDYMWMLVRTASIKDASGEIQKIVGVMVDIDRAKKSEEILMTRASFDALTGIYNRESVESLIGNEIELVAARKDEFAILFVDVDNFKHYNDDYSHATGDQVLKFTAQALKNIIGDNGIVGRYGGDEFVACLKETGTNDPSEIAKEILQRLKDGFTSAADERLTVSVSIGIALVRDTSKRVDEIIGMADDAMYNIKKAGKSDFGFINNE